MKKQTALAVEFKNIFEKYELEIKLESGIVRESFQALNDVSFSINAGETVAVIGPNGAGKSTLLRLLAGLLQPEKGEIKVCGRVASLLDLGAGFHPELTGRDNVLLNASLYKFDRQEINAKLEQIFAFADIGKFIDVPVRCYSQGMYVRLAFSLAIHVDPDILLIDDCLAVGDDDFRLKSVDKALELKALGKTIVFVTHDFGTAKQVCDRGIYLRQGRIVEDGPIDVVVERYVSPLSIDPNKYRYLGGKVLEDEAQRKEEETRRHQEQALRWKEEEARQQNDLDVRLKQREDLWQVEEDQRRHREIVTWAALEQKRREDDTAAWVRMEEARRRCEAEAWQRLEDERRQVEAGRYEADRAVWVQEESLRREQDNKTWGTLEQKRREEDTAAWVRMEEDRRRQEAEAWQREEDGRRQKEVEAWAALEQKRREDDTKAWVHAEEERRRREAIDWDLAEQKRLTPATLVVDPWLRLVVKPGRVQIFVDDREVTQQEGLRALFTADGLERSSSLDVLWRVRQVSPQQIVCCLKWRKPSRCSQVWKFTLLPEGAVGFEILMKDDGHGVTQNERVEGVFAIKVGIVDEADLGMKSTAFFGEATDLVFETLSDRQVCGIGHPSESVFQPYFLTAQPVDGGQEHSKRREYFKGRFYLKRRIAPALTRKVLSDEISCQKLEVVFKEGFVSVWYGHQKITEGAGLYTSLFSKGIWYDSGQAVWMVEDRSPQGLKLRGAWPWLPIIQYWEITLKDERTIALDYGMRVVHPVQVNMQETVLMLNKQYTRWAEEGRWKDFSDSLTRDDHFRVCLMSVAADGQARASASSEDLPRIDFVPGPLQGSQIIVENAGHMDGLPARMFHCLRFNKAEGLCLMPGEHTFFKGEIHINKEQV